MIDSLLSELLYDDPSNPEWACWYPDDDPWAPPLDLPYQPWPDDFFHCVACGRDDWVRGSFTTTGVTCETCTKEQAA